MYSKIHFVSSSLYITRTTLSKWQTPNVFAKMDMKNFTKMEHVFPMMIIKAQVVINWIVIEVIGKKKYALKILAFISKELYVSQYQIEYVPNQLNFILFLKLVNWIKKVSLFVTALIPYLMENFVIITFVLIIVKMEDFVHIPCKKTNQHHQ